MPDLSEAVKAAKAHAATDFYMCKTHKKPDHWPKQSAWSSRSLAGKWRHGFFYLVLRLFGVKAAKIPLFFVVLVYCLRPSIAGRAGHYLRRRFKGGPTFVARFEKTFKLYWNFGSVLVERAASGILGRFKVTPDPQCLAVLQALLAEGKGLLLLSAHVGAWQIALAGLFFGVKVNIVQPRDGQDQDLHVFEHASGSAEMYGIIDPQDGFGGFIAMQTALRRGEIVCLMGDRLMPEEKLVVRTDFLGEKALFPGSAYLLASMTGAPVAVVLSRRSGECEVDCSCAAAFSVPRGLKKTESALRPYAAFFASALEQYVKEEPYQFFNFHNFWLTEGKNDA